MKEELKKICLLKIEKLVYMAVRPEAGLFLRGGVSTANQPGIGT